MDHHFQRDDQQQRRSFFTGLGAFKPLGRVSAFDSHQRILNERNGNKDAAGLIALLVPTSFGVDLLTTFLKLWGTSAGQQMLGTIVWHAPVGAALLGGLLAFVVPSVGALLLGTAGAA